MQAKRLTHYAVTLGIVPDTQFGGVPGRSVEDAGLTFAHDVETAAQSRLATSAVTLDITGYFDRVSHPRLLTVLHEAKLPGPLVRWVSSFLSARQTAICVDGKVGEMAPVETGIPQGSPVSPILAAIFSKTLDTRIRAAAPAILALLPARHRPVEGRMIMYVDDVKLYTASKSLDTNVRYLAALYRVAMRWASDEGLLLDDEKRDFTHFVCSLRKLDGRRIKTLPRPALRVPSNDGTVRALQPATSYRWLGIIWDPRLSFGPHVKRMAERGASAASALSMLGNTKSGMRPVQLRQIHVACVLPVLMFGALVWFTGHRQATLLRHLDVVVRRSARHVLGAFKTTPSEILHLEASLPEMRLLLQARAESGAIRFARLHRRHPVLQRLGADWCGNVLAENPPPLAAPTNPSRLTRIQRLAQFYPADGERIEPFLLAPWDDPVGDARWTGRLTINPRQPGMDKPTAAAEHVKRLRQLESGSANVIAYTDGSLLDGKAGAGFVVFHKRRRVAARQIGLGMAAEVYDGELRGLELAASAAFPFAANLPYPAHVYFFADNTAAVSQVFTRRPAAGQTYSIGFARSAEDFLLQDSGHKVSVEWVPGHEDVSGQEVSDELAKGGTTRAPSLPFSLTITRAKRDVKQRLRERLRARWLEQQRRGPYAPANRFPPSLQPTPHLRAYDKRILSALTQCRSGHAFTGEYYRAINKPERGLGCPCGEAIQTRDHVIRDCPEYEMYRHILRDVSPGLIISDLLGTREGISALAKFVRRSGAFGRPTTVGVDNL